jgi:hypothetical protein
MNRRIWTSVLVLVLVSVLVSIFGRPASGFRLPASGFRFYDTSVVGNGFLGMRAGLFSPYFGP